MARMTKTDWLKTAQPKDLAFCGWAWLDGVKPKKGTGHFIAHKWHMGYSACGVSLALGKPLEPVAGWHKSYFDLCSRCLKKVEVI